MTIAEWCLLAAVILYLMAVAPVKAFSFREFDNANPREPAFYKPGPRALGAHVNGIETFPFFAAAVLLAEMRHCPQNRIDMLALLFVALRVLYVLAYLVAYLGNAPTTRTLLWNAAFIANAGIFLLPPFAR